MCSKKKREGEEEEDSFTPGLSLTQIINLSTVKSLR